MDLTDIQFLRNGVKNLIKHPKKQHGLYDKQVDALRALISDKFSDEQISHSYFRLPTGFGKTIMFAAMAHAYFDNAGPKRQKIIVIVPRLSLINQTKEKLEKFGNVIATEYSGRKKDNDSDVIITTYHSLNKLFGVIDFNNVGLIFADEAHHMLGNKISEQLKFYNDYVPVIGFTATPAYEANRTVAHLLNTEIYAMNISDAVEEGILSPVKNVLYRSSVVCDLASVPICNNGDYDYDNIITKINPNILATEIARIYADGFDENTGIEFKNLRTIINCPNTKMANIQADKINEIMGRNVAVSLHTVGTNDANFKKLQDEFIAGKYSVACQVGTMTEGFDDVTVSMCINYPTRSRVKAEQTAGRTIRPDENNPNKIAFVVDTIFRSKPDEKIEDILYTASIAQQVLFKDIAGGKTFLFSKDLKKRIQNINKTETRKKKDVVFVDFELITDSAILLELNQRAMERLNNETPGEKTPEWKAAIELSKDNTFPLKSYALIAKKLSELQPEMPQYIQMRKPKSGRAVLCLHQDAWSEFLKKLNYEDYPIKTSEWQSAEDLKTDKTFPEGSTKKILRELQELQPEMPQYIQMRKIRYGQTCLCLHRDGRQEFLKKLNYEDYPVKTSEWQSADDLKNDKTFLVADAFKLRRKLKEFQPEMPQYIKMRKLPANGKNCLCLHRNGREMFLEKIGANYPLVTDEWQSSEELNKDKTFPMGIRTHIKQKMVELHSEMPQYIQIRKTRSGHTCWCLHRDGRKMFLEKAGIPECPVKTPEWQAASELSKDKTFPMQDTPVIRGKMLKFQPEMPQYIQTRKSLTGAIGLYLHRDGRQKFLELVKQDKIKSIKKTTEIISANIDLKQTANNIKRLKTEKKVKE